MRDDADREKRLDGLRRTVEVYGWRLHAFVLMTHHDPLFVEAPEANLSAGMQHYNGSYTRGTSIVGIDVRAICFRDDSKGISLRRRAARNCSEPFNDWNKCSLISDPGLTTDRKRKAGGRVQPQRHNDTKGQIESGFGGRCWARHG